MSEPRQLVVGHITKAHGTRGEVFVWPLTDRPDELFGAGREVLLGTADGELAEPREAVVVERVRPFQRGLLVKFEGVDDRDAAEPLTRRYLLSPIAALEPLEEGEVFYHQLLGLQVVTVDGETVGEVREVYDTQPAHLLEVKGATKLHLIPFTDRIVKKIDVEGGKLLIKPPPGLLDL